MTTNCLELSGSSRFVHQFPKRLTITVLSTNCLEAEKEILLNISEKLIRRGFVHQLPWAKRENLKKRLVLQLHRTKREAKRIDKPITLSKREFNIDRND